MLTRGLLVLATCAALHADEYYPRESLEIGVERYSAARQKTETTSSGILVNYYPSRVFHIGTSQSVTTTDELVNVRRLTYRPDIHLGFTIPLIDTLFAELTMGVDLVTGLIIAAAIASEDKNSRNWNFNHLSGYSGYVNFGTALRWHVDTIALKVIGQMQYGGYSESAANTLNSSAWIGLGATCRFAL